MELLTFQDVVDPVTDEMLAKFVVESHFKSQPKGANMDEKSLGESQDVYAAAMPADPEVVTVNPASSFALYLWLLYLLRDF